MQTRFPTISRARAGCSCLLVFLACLGLVIGAAHGDFGRDADTENARHPAWISGIYLLDKTLAQDSVEAVSAQPDSAFSQLSHGLSAGYGLQPHWLKIRLQRAADAPSTYWLELSPAYLDHIDFFSPEFGGESGSPRFSRVSTGDLHLFSSRPLAHRRFVFPVELPDSAPRDFYLRIQTRSAAIAQVALRTPVEIEQNAHGDYFWQGIILGALIVILYVAFTHWHMLRQRFALLLCAQTLTTLIAYMGINGTAAEFLSPALPIVGDLATSIGSSLMTACTLWFFMEFFQLANISRWVTCFYQFVIGVCLLAAISALTDHYSLVAPWMYALSLCTIPITLCVSYNTPEQEVVGSRWVFFGYLFITFSIGSNLLVLLGILPPYKLLPYITQFLSPMQLLFLQQAVQARVRENERLRRVAEMRACEAETRTSVMAVQRAEQAKFLSLITHELKTPLAVIDSAVQAIQYAQASQISIDVEERHRRIRDAVFRLNILLESALSEERTANQSLTPHSEKIAIASLIAEINAIAPIRLPADYPASCHADRTLLRIALGNLADNARKYALPTPPIELSIAPLQHEGRVGVTFSVSNFCAGPLPDDTQQWFSKYYRANHEREGIGLGLYLIRQIAEAHGGFSSISVAAAETLPLPNFRITVSIWLPDEEKQEHT